MFYCFVLSTIRRGFSKKKTVTFNIKSFFLIVFFNTNLFFCETASVNSVRFQIWQCNNTCQFKRNVKKLKLTLNDLFSLISTFQSLYIECSLWNRIVLSILILSKCKICWRSVANVYYSVRGARGTDHTAPRRLAQRANTKQLHIADENVGRIPIDLKISWMSCTFLFQRVSTLWKRRLDC